VLRRRVFGLTIRRRVSALRVLTRQPFYPVNRRSRTPFHKLSGVFSLENFAAESSSFFLCFGFFNRIIAVRVWIDRLGGTLTLNNFFLAPRAD
jgi:hypothetical protein